MAGEQQQHRPSSRKEEQPLDQGAASQARKENLDSDIESILDEIDDVLEQNAEEFVKGFVQKGGQ